MKEYSITKILCLTVIFLCFLSDVIDGTQLYWHSITTIGLLLGTWCYFNLYCYGADRIKVALLNQTARRHGDACWGINPEYVWFTWVKK